MKKYIKAIFCAVFLVVFIGLLIYRTEYLKLWYTFEAGGLLTVPKPPSNCLVINKTVVGNQRDFSRFSYPRSSWTVVNNLHVFSAFISDSHDSWSAVALGMGRSHDCLKYKCHIWFTLNDLKFSTDGTFSCLQFGNVSNSYSLLEFNCEVEKSSANGKPYIFVFIDESNSKYFVPIHVKKKKPSHQGSALCILPDFSGLDPLALVEFLSYHQLIGFTDIIVYDSRLQYDILNSLNFNLGSIKFFESFSLIEWNFPYNDIQAARDIIFRDCLYRMEGQSKVVAFLEWSMYIIPTVKQSISGLFKYLDVDKTNVLSMSLKKCCANSKDNIVSNKSWPMVFRKTSCLAGFKNHSSNKFLPHSAFNFVEVSPSDFYINEYGACDPDLPTIQDSKALNFFSELLESTLLKIWKSGSLLE